jgi:hypothetical protein
MPYRSFSAIAPIVMSLVAMAVILLPDQGNAIQVFNLLLMGQAPVVAFFAMKWLPRDPARSLQVLGVQALAAALALVPSVFFGA